MSARAMHCLGCGVDTSLSSPAVAAELNDVRRLHPSHPTWTPGGAA
jgi:hypothetical protein